MGLRRLYWDWGTRKSRETTNSAGLVGPRSHRTQSTSQQVYAQNGTHYTVNEDVHTLQETLKGLCPNLHAILLTPPTGVWTGPWGFVWKLDVPIVGKKSALIGNTRCFSSFARHVMPGDHFGWSGFPLGKGVNDDYDVHKSCFSFHFSGRSIALLALGDFCNYVLAPLCRSTFSVLNECKDPFARLKRARPQNPRRPVIQSGCVVRHENGSKLISTKSKSR